MTKKSDHRTYEEKFGKEKADEIKKKIGNSCKGKMSGSKNPMYGKTGEKHPRFGKKYSVEKRKQISNHRKGKCVGKDNPFYGKDHTDEVKQIISKANKGKVLSKEHRIILSDSAKKNKGKSFDERYGKEKSDKTKAKLREKRLKQVFPNVSSIELNLRNALINKGYDYFQPQYSFKVAQMDIAFIKEKIAIFCDGDYWHNFPDGTERDRNQDKVLKENGWTVLRFWEHDIRKNIDSCINIIIETLIKIKEEQL